MAISALLQGLFGASSLLLGAVIALVWTPSKQVSATVMAFGSGTLLAAIAFEIALKSYLKSGFLPILIGFVIGGFLFTAITQYVDNKGGFLRRPSSSRRYLVEQHQESITDIMSHLAKSEVMQNLTLPERQAIAPLLITTRVAAGTVLCREGDIGDYFYIIAEGEAEVRKGAKVLALLEPGEVFGEMSLLTGDRRSATVIAKTPMELYQLNQEYFENVLTWSPHMAWALSRALAQRLKLTTESQLLAEQNLDHWQQQLLNQVELNQLLQKNSVTLKSLAQRSAPLAILIGSLIDNIPEATVIGINAGEHQMAWSFLFAVFISNFPESLSSATGMKQAGSSNRHILSLWLGVLILAGFFALFGYYLHNMTPPLYIALGEAVAGGAILAMLASTMMPEAYELGGGLVSFATIAGFLLCFFISASSWQF